nr:hypothetical protein [Tanacetum cinerariifolium]
MDMTIDQQVALDKALVLHARRLRIGKSNFRLRSDIKSKESTLQVVYDVLKLTLFYKAFLVTTDVPEIYMQEFWATAIVYHHSIRFKINNKKRIVNLEYFREMLQISSRIANQQFDELPFEDEILAFLRELGHSGEIKRITDVNINKLNQPWRSFAAVINKCLSGKSTDFVYQVEHKDAKKRNEMYYPRFTKVIVNFFMTKDQSILSRTKYGVMLPIELTTKSIKYFESYKEYYAVSSGAEPPKTKASVRKKKSSYDTTVPPPTPKGKKTQDFRKDKVIHKKEPDTNSYITCQWISDDDDEVKISKHDDDVYDQSEDDDQDNDDDQDEQSGDDDPEDQDDANQEDRDDDGQDDQGDDDDEQSDSDNNGDDFAHPKFSTHDEEAKDEESFDPIEDEGANEEDDADELYIDVNIHLKGRDIQMEDVQTTQVIEDTHVTLAMVNPDAPSQANVLSSSLQDLPNFGLLFGFDHRLKTLETNFLEFMQTNQFTKAVSLIIGIVDKYIHHWMNEAVKVAIQLQSDRLQDEAQAKNEDFINKLNENIQKIIKEQVKEKVKVQVSKILLKIEKTVNEQLEAEILIEKMKRNKLIYRSDEQKNLYKALIDAYELEEPMHITQHLEEPTPQNFKTGATDDQPVKEASHLPHWFQKQAKPLTPDHAWNKTLPATHGCIHPWISNLTKKADSCTSFNELMDTSINLSAFVMNRLKVYTLTPDLLADPTYELMKGSCKSLVELELFLEEPLPLIPNSWGRRVIPFDHFINNDFEYLRGGASSRKYTTSVTKTKAADYGHIKWIKDLGANVNSSMDLQSTGNLLEMSTLNVESSLSQSYKSSNGITTSIWIGSLYVEMMASSTNSRK